MVLHSRAYASCGGLLALICFFQADRHLVGCWCFQKGSWAALLSFSCRYPTLENNTPSRKAKRLQTMFSVFERSASKRMRMTA